MANVVGEWIITTDFGCDGSIAGTFNQTFNADGTWTNTIGSNGRWYQIEGLVVWDFNNAAKLVYAANLTGSWMTGDLGFTTAGGLKGCFGAHRVGVPGLAERLSKRNLSVPIPAKSISVITVQGGSGKEWRTQNGVRHIRKLGESSNV